MNAIVIFLGRPSARAFRPRFHATSGFFLNRRITSWRKTLLETSIEQTHVTTRKKT